MQGSVALGTVRSKSFGWVNPVEAEREKPDGRLLVTNCGRAVKTRSMSGL